MFIIIYSVLSLSSLTTAYQNTGEIFMSMPSDPKQSIFLYFAYAANMLEKRLHLEIPDAVFHSPGVLKKHRLDFTTEVSWWNGAIATVCKDAGESVWGILWELKYSDKGKLDAQEGLYLGWYHIEQLLVNTPDGHEVPALTYVQNHAPRKLAPWETPPPERQPSATYLRVMILGAIQGGLPVEYIRYLYTINHNGKRASSGVIAQLGSPFTDISRKINIQVYV